MNRAAHRARTPPAHPTRVSAALVAVAAGGVEYLTTHLRDLRHGRKNTLTVADGYSGASFPWLAANVTYKAGVKVPAPANSRHHGKWFRASTGRTVLPPTWVKKVDGIKVGFIGMTLENTPGAPPP